MSMDQNSFPPFRPHPLFRGGHAQTLAGYYVRPQGLNSEPFQHLVTLDDGDLITLHDDCPGSWQPGDRVVFLVPGVGGSYESPFMPRVASKLNDAGFRTFCMDHRGSGPAFDRAQNLGHAGRSEDARATILKIADVCPESPLTAVGFSMGGNILLKMMGEYGDETIGRLDSCFAVAPPIDIEPCAKFMQRRSNIIYSRAFANSLVDHVKKRQPFVETMQPIPLKPRPKTLWEFDDRFTAPLSGFRDAVDYYTQSSSKSVLHRVAIPTQIIAAENDPMIPASIYDGADFSPTTEILITPSGGHLGYFGVAGVDPDRRWMDWRIVNWIREFDAGRVNLYRK